MSKVEAQKTYLIATAIGTVKIIGQLITGFDVEDIIHSQAISQARLVQLANIGRDISANAILPTEVLPSIFKNNIEEF